MRVCQEQLLTGFLFDFETNQSLSELQAEGWQVEQYALDDQDGTGDLPAIGGAYSDSPFHQIVIQSSRARSAAWSTACMEKVSWRKGLAPRQKEIAVANWLIAFA